MQNKIVFHSKDLLASNFSIDLSSLGLLQAVEGLTLYSKSLSYNFLHLSVQELLAAYNISMMDPSGQVKVFKKLFESFHFEAVLQYYSGFTKLNNPDIQEFISSCQHGKSHLKDLLPLLHCFYEAQQPSLCQLVDPRFDPDVFDCDFLSSVGHLAVGYYINSVLSTSRSNSPRMSCVSLTYKVDEDQHGLKLLLGELSKYPIGGLQTDGKESRKMSLDLAGISEQGAKHIASYLKQSSAFSALWIRWSDENGMLSIVEALQTNSSFTELHLIDSLPNLTEQTSSALIKMLQMNRSLTHLQVSNDTEYIVEFDLSASADLVFRGIFEGLHYTALVNLSLLENCITATDPDTARSLTKMLQLNDSLTHLDLSWNSLSDSGARCIFEGLQHNTTLVSLSLHAEKQYNSY